MRLTRTFPLKYNFPCLLSAIQVCTRMLWRPHRARLSAHSGSRHPLPGKHQVTRHTAAARDITLRTVTFQRVPVGQRREYPRPRRQTTRQHEYTSGGGAALPTRRRGRARSPSAGRVELVMATPEQRRARGAGAGAPPSLNCGLGVRQPQSPPAAPSAASSTSAWLACRSARSDPPLSGVIKSIVFVGVLRRVRAAIDLAAPCERPGIGPCEVERPADRPSQLCDARCSKSRAASTRRYIRRRPEMSRGSSA